MIRLFNQQIFCVITRLKVMNVECEVYESETDVIFSHIKYIYGMCI